jgi:hypothetical protein
MSANNFSHLLDSFSSSGGSMSVPSSEKLKVVGLSSGSVMGGQGKTAPGMVSAAAVLLLLRNSVVVKVTTLAIPAKLTNEIVAIVAAVTEVATAAAAAALAIAAVILKEVAAALEAALLAALTAMFCIT